MTCRRAVADIIDDRLCDIGAQAEDDDFGVTIIGEQADRKCVSRSSLVPWNGDDVAPVLANIAEDRLVGFDFGLGPFELI
jgi:hypothetical protein